MSLKSMVSGFYIGIEASACVSLFTLDVSDVAFVLIVCLLAWHRQSNEVGCEQNGKSASEKSESWELGLT